jgi:hypothetical protein
MTTGFAVNTANKILDAIGNGVPYSVANTFMKLHIGDPGAAGTANPATETSRKAASFGTPSAGGMTNDVALTWAGIAGSQDATHFSLWDAVTNGTGTFIASGTITAPAYIAGDAYVIAIGDAHLNLAVAA